MFERTGVCLVAGMIGLAGWVMLAPAASAQETAPAKVQPLEGDTWIHRTTAVDGHLGVATPQGSLGVSLTQTFDRTFALSGSVGLGFTGPHLSVMPRAQIPWDWGAVGIGVGMTGSNYTGFTFCDRDTEDCSDDTYRAITLVLWTNAELFVVFQSQESGLRLGLYGGWTSVAATFNEREVNTETGEDPVGPLPYYTDYSIVGGTTPYGGITLGYAF